MADHILGHTKKCVKTGNGSFYDSGGPAPTSNGPGVGYRSGERDYFIMIRLELVPIHILNLLSKNGMYMIILLRQIIMTL